MITIRDFMETVDYRITEGGEYGWRCYGDNSYCISAWNGLHGDGGWSINLVFDTVTQVVYEMEACCYTNNRAYRIIHPDYRNTYNSELSERGLSSNFAWDDVPYIDLEEGSDMLEKARSIVASVEYDTRISVPVDLGKDELLDLCLEAHRRDITVNQLVLEILKKEITESSHA